MGNLAEEFTGKLVNDKEIKSHLKVRSSAFVFEKVDNRLQSDYDSAEWTLHKTNKKSVVLKKKKPLHVMFEDRVCTILAKMGFTTLNNKGLRLPYVDDESIPGKQIDAIAADNETIIVVECKSAEAMKKTALLERAERIRQSDFGWQQDIEKGLFRQAQNSVTYKIPSPILTLHKSEFLSIDCLVGVGEGVDEGLERSPEEFVEDILERIALGTCENRVFEDMRHTCRVARRCPETDGEEVFPVVAVEVEDCSSRFFVFDLVGGDPDLRDLLDPPYLKTVPPVSCAKRRRRADLFCHH